MPKKFEDRSLEGGEPKRDPILERIGTKIKELRANANLSQRQLGEAAGISQPHLMMVEVGGPSISVIMLCNIAKVFGVPISVFFDETDEITSMGPVFAKLAADLHRADDVLESQRDTISKILRDLEDRLEQLEKASKPKTKKN